MSETKAEARKPSDEKIFKRQELIGALAAKTGMPRPKAAAAIEALLEVVTGKLTEGHEVRLLNFGSWVVTDRKAGKGRDPRTGAEIDIPESKTVRFRPARALRDAVAGKAGGAEESDAE